MNFSVIIPTRNRPHLLKKAIESVISQTYDSFEIIVVNDGSDETHLSDYEAIEKEFGSKIQILSLEKSLNGHGQSYPINIGAMHAKGQFVCFLDDDDFWVENEHLAIAAGVITESEKDLDVYFSNQMAFKSGAMLEEPLWLSLLEEIISAKINPLLSGAYRVDVDLLLECPGFSHLNTTIVRKKTFFAINGMDENIRWECDLDFYLRLIDYADHIVFNPIITSQHNVPDDAKTDNMTTALSMLGKMLFRMHLLDKAIITAKKPAIVSLAMKHKSYTLKRMTEILVANKDYKLALFYAKEPLLIGFSFKWLCYYFYIKYLYLFSSTPSAHDQTA